MGGCAGSSDCVKGLGFRVQGSMKLALSGPPNLRKSVCSRGGGFRIGTVDDINPALP